MARQTGFLTSLALAAIRGYQRYISPHKGFSCAYRCATGRDGCSGYGCRVIDRFGARTGLMLLRRLLRLCGDTHRGRLTVPNPMLHHQQGHCDLPCDLDVGGCSGCSFDFGPGGRKARIRDRTKKHCRARPPCKRKKPGAASTKKPISRMSVTC